MEKNTASESKCVRGNFRAFRWVVERERHDQRRITRGNISAYMQSGKSQRRNKKTIKIALCLSPYWVTLGIYVIAFLLKGISKLNLSKKTYVLNEDCAVFLTRTERCLKFGHDYLNIFALYLKQT